MTPLGPSTISNHGYCWYTLMKVIPGNGHFPLLFCFHHLHHEFILQKITEQPLSVVTNVPFDMLGIPIVLRTVVSWAEPPPVDIVPKTAIPPVTIQGGGFIITCFQCKYPVAHKGFLAFLKAVWQAGFHCQGASLCSNLLRGLTKVAWLGMDLP